MGALGYHFKMEYIFGRTATLILCYLISIPTWLLYPYYHYFCLLMRHFTSLIQSSNDFHTKCTPLKSYNNKYFVIDIIFEKGLVFIISYIVIFIFQCLTKIYFYFYFSIVES